MKFKQGDLVTTVPYAEDFVKLYDRQPSPVTQEGLRQTGTIDNGAIGLIISTNSDSTIVCVLGTQGFGFTFGSWLRKIESL